MKIKKKYLEILKVINFFFNQLGIIIDQNLRKRFIEKEFKKISKRKNIILETNNKLLDEVADLVDQPNIILCKFDIKFLKIPKEILIITMQYHQKYFPTFDQKGNITNEFLVVANNKDIKGFIKSGQ